MDEDSFEFLKHLAFAGNFNPLLSAIDNDNSLLYRQDRWGYVILHWISRYGLNQCIIELLKRGCDINILHPTGWNALMFAAECNKIETVLLLIDKGANLMAGTQQGSNALSIYGIRAVPSITIQQKTECRNIILYVWLDKQRRNNNWERRWSFMNAMYGSGYKLLLSKEMVLKMETNSLDELVKTKIILTTPAEKHAYLRDSVFYNEGLVRIVGSYL
jgi:hypothetical protein